MIICGLRHNVKFDAVTDKDQVGVPSPMLSITKQKYCSNYDFSVFKRLDLSITDLSMTSEAEAESGAGSWLERCVRLQRHTAATERIINLLRCVAASHN